MVTRESDTCNLIDQAAVRSTWNALFVAAMVFAAIAVLTILPVKKVR